MNVTHVLAFLIYFLCVYPGEGTEFQYLQQQYEGLKNDLLLLKKAYIDKKQDVENIQKLYTSTTQQLKGKLVQVESLVKSGTSDLALSNHKRLANYQFDQVAFDARLSHKQDHAGSEETIVFDTVLTNVGGRYDKNLGFFEAPLTGTYLFSWTIASDYGTSIIPRLNVNGNAVASMHTDTGIPKTFRGSTSKVTILNLNRNDRVYVTITYNRGVIVSDDSSHSSFEGALLYTTEE